MRATITLDEFPHELRPDKILEYSSKFCLSLIYMPIFVKKNGFITSGLVSEIKKENSVIFLLKERYWSNGERITSKMLKDFFINYLQSENSFKKYLSFIKGTEKMFLNDFEIDKVEIYCNNIYELEIVMNEFETYHDILSAIQFSLFYEEKKTCNKLKIMGCGPYQLAKVCEKSESIMLVDNSFYHEPKQIKIIDIKTVKDTEITIRDYLLGAVDFTNTTSFPKELIETLNQRKDFFYESSNIEISLIINQKDILVYKSILQTYLKNMIRKDNLLVRLINVDVDQILYEKGHYLTGSDTYEFKMLLPNYYPNQEVCQKIVNFFNEKGYKLTLVTKELDEFVYESKNNSNEYDIIYQLTSNIINSELTELIAELTYIFDDRKEEYKLLLIKYLSSEVQEKQVDGIKLFIKKYSRRVTIGKVNHVYLKNEKMSQLYIDDNDMLQIKEE